MKLGRRVKLAGSPNSKSLYVPFEAQVRKKISTPAEILCELFHGRRRRSGCTSENYLRRADVPKAPLVNASANFSQQSRFFRGHLIYVLPLRVRESALVCASASQLLSENSGRIAQVSRHVMRREVGHSDYSCVKGRHVYAFAYL